MPTKRDLLLSAVRRVTTRSPRVSRGLTALLSDDTLFDLIAPQRRHVWIIAAPKSGSTWLSALLTTLLGWKTNALAPGGDRREQEIDPRLLVTTTATEDLLSVQQHCRFSEPTLRIMVRAGMTSILTTRNLADSVVSFVDHLDRETTVLPHAFMTQEDWADFTAEDKTHFVVKMIMPWMFNFYGGWLTYLQSPSQPAPVHLCPYERLVEDPESTLAGLVEAIGIGKPAAAIAKAVEDAATVPTRKNKARIGRGTQLSGSVMDELAKMARYYPRIDFGRYGLL